MGSGTLNDPAVSRVVYVGPNYWSNPRKLPMVNRQRRHRFGSMVIAAELGAARLNYTSGTVQVAG